MTGPSRALAIPAPQTLSSWGDRKLDNAIQRGHATAGAHMQGYEEAAAVTGLLLMERRERCGSRKFSPWIEQHFNGSRKTAYRYIELAEEAGLSVSRATQIEPPDEPHDDDPEEVEPDEVLPPDGSGGSEPEGGEFVGDPEEDYADIRAQLIGWFAKGRVVVRLLQDGTDLRALPPQDRKDLLGDAELMASTATRVKEALIQ